MGMDTLAKKPPSAAVPAGRFRKKPVIVEAFQTPTASPPPWFKEALRDGGARELGDGTYELHTLEGDHHASAGDFIIQGVKGELYPCKPDIFQATYDPA